MKHKIVIKLPLHDEKCKATAMKIAVVAAGVSKVEVGKDQLVVIGEEVDSVNLALKLRKKLGHAIIDKVEEQKEEKKEEKNEEIKPTTVVPWASSCVHHPLSVPIFEVPSHSDPPGCFIL